MAEKSTLLRTIGVFVFLITYATGTVCSTEFFISTNGSDSNPGTFDQPVQTAEAVMRHIGNLTDVESPVTVYFRGGAYHLKSPVVIRRSIASSSTQSITFSAWADEIVVLSGGTELHLDWKPYQNGIFKAAINQDHYRIDELYVNDRRYHMARFPNYDPDAKFLGGTSPEAVAPERVQTWSNPTGGYLHALHEGLWGSKHYRIENVQTGHTLILKGGWQENRGGGFDPYYRGGYHNEYLFVENIREELDAPGEWFLDQSANTLYVYPYSNDSLSDVAVVGTRLHEIIRLEGSEKSPITNIHFRNLRFKYTSRIFMQPYERLLRGDWSISRLSAVRFAGTENCSITGCHFENLGGNGVFLDGYSRNNTIANNHFIKIGESAICVAGNVDAVRSPAISYSNTLPQDEIDLTPGPQSNNYPAQCIVHNNLIHDIGLTGKQTAGVFISMAEEITVSHNTIFNCPRAAICINDGCWGGHIVEYNDAFNTVSESGDHGPFNSWGRDRYWKTSYNGGRDIEPFAKERALLDHYKTTHIRYNRFAHDGGHSWGIDLDDGSSNYHVYKNLCIGMGVKLREGFFRRVENNIIINGFGGFHIWFPECEDIIERNIFVSGKPYQFIRANPSHAKSFDNNLFYYNGEEPVITGVGDEMPIHEWQKKGFDTHSLVANPQFVDPSEGDYRVHEDSPAMELGFENFPMDRFGVLTQEFRGIVAQTGRRSESTFQPHTISSERQEEKTMWLGAFIKNLVGEDEKSAAGMGEITGVIFVQIPKISPAEKFGFKEGDVIIKWNQTPVDTVSDLLKLDSNSSSFPVEVTVMNAVERVIIYKK